MAPRDVTLDLIRRAQAGEPQALVRLVETCQDAVYSLAVAMMRDRADAADMTQETFIRLLKTIGSYRGDGLSFASWVHRLTVNICLDTLRYRQRHPQASLELSPDAEDAPAREFASADLWQQPEWRAEARELRQEIGAALAELPRSQRRALFLHYFEDRGYDEIAAAMDVPLNTVKSHILRGKQRMAHLLEGRSMRSTTAPRFAAAS
jgi:RNA polymerase sigma-70 factor (ECF subfamily)